MSLGLGGVAHGPNSSPSSSLKKKQEKTRIPRKGTKFFLGRGGGRGGKRRVRRGGEGHFFNVLAFLQKKKKDFYDCF